MKIRGIDIKSMNVRWTPSAIWLVIVNLIPIAGVAFFAWNVGTLLLLYWVESAVLGILNIPKIISCVGRNKLGSRPEGFGSRLFLTIFFTFHYGMFSYGHLFFLSSFFDSVPPMGDVLNEIVSGKGLLLSVMGLSLSHLISMLINFYGKKEYLTRPAGTQMFLPYGRIAIMHFVIIFGGILVQAFGAPILMLILLAALKITIDLIAHSLEHNGLNVRA